MFLMEKVIKYSRHARRRMKWRNISQSEVEHILRKPDKIDSSMGGRINVFKMINGRFIKVTYKESPDEILIITAVEKEV